MNVIPTSCWIRFSSSCICRLSFRSRAPSGSSSSSTRGSLTSSAAPARPAVAGRRRADAACVSPARRARRARARARRVPRAACPDSSPAQAEGDVLEDREVREERVALEDRVDVAAVRRQAGHVLLAEVDRARSRLLEAADHPKRRGLAAARRAEEGEEAAVVESDRDAVDGDDVVEALRDPVEAHVELGDALHPPE